MKIVAWSYREDSRAGRLQGSRWLWKSWKSAGSHSPKPTTFRAKVPESVVTTWRGSLLGALVQPPDQNAHVAFRSIRRSAGHFVRRLLPTLVFLQGSLARHPRSCHKYLQSLLLGRSVKCQSWLQRFRLCQEPNGGRPTSKSYGSSTPTRGMPRMFPSRATTIQRYQKSLLNSRSATIISWPWSDSPRYSDLDDEGWFVR
mmetsp:Transcript_58397/g.126356  ORF Transcript_58397/g.126356 Transcript_58397/m.126356 type:complete len:200 (+) Transcript_58397:594-1193(+)